MNLSRRAALRAGAGVVAGSTLAGCVEQRVTRRTSVIDSSVVWPLSPETGDSLTAPAFDEYADQMRDRYGDNGVWGQESERADEFETAYVSRLAATRETPGDPGGTASSLVPDDVDPDAPLLFADACVAVYRVDENRYRYWLWAAADSTDGRLIQDVDLASLSTGVRFRDGALADAAQASTAGDGVTVTLGGGPSATFPLHGGTVETTSNLGAAGDYTVEWGGTVDGVQSVNAVCEEERDGAYDLFWSVAAGYSFEEDV